jgi:anti-sigma regulatory factor (Ser/Thr protein kinase)
MHKKFARNYNSLEEMFEFTEFFFDSEEIAVDVRFSVHFVMEELFTNMVKYNQGNSNEILVAIERDQSKVTASLTDYDVDEFDVTLERNVDTSLSLEERRIGGLGVHLIQKMVDSLQYRYKDRQSKVTFSKELEIADV